MLSSLTYLPASITLSSRHACMIYMHNHADWGAIREGLHVISEMYFSLNATCNRSVEENWQFIHQKFLELVNTHVPCKALRSGHHLSWMSTPLKCLIRKNSMFTTEPNISSVSLTGRSTEPSARSSAVITSLTPAVHN